MNQRRGNMVGAREFTYICQRPLCGQACSSDRALAHHTEVYHRSDLGGKPDSDANAKPVTSVQENEYQKKMWLQEAVQRELDAMAAEEYALANGQGQRRLDREPSLMAEEEVRPQMTFEPDLRSSANRILRVEQWLSALPEYEDMLEELPTQTDLGRAPTEVAGETARSQDEHVNYRSLGQPQ